MILPIRTLGDPVLRQPSRPVVEFDRKLRRLVEDMTETMYAAPGVGLAAPQVGLSLRVFVFDDGQTGASCVVNPVLVDPDGEVEEEEGCLSLPGPYHPTRRAKTIVCRGFDANGAALELRGEALLARIFQHESDHLDGKLYIDRLDDDGRRAVLAERRRIELGLQEPGSRTRA
jgi:peptide deformylase